MKNLRESKSFTTRYAQITNVLHNQVTILEPFDPKDGLDGKKEAKVRAIWDTGASGSVITADVVAALGLVPTGRKLVHTAAGPGEVNTYIVNIGLPNSVGVAGVTVTEGIVEGYGALVGMDIITLGDFAVTHCGGETCFSFRIPSCETIDFVDMYHKKFGKVFLTEDEIRKERNRRRNQRKKHR